MNLEADIEPVATDDWPERRLAAARRLGRLMRRLGRDAVDSPDSLNAAMAEALVKCPPERAVLSDALKLRAADEINRLRGTGEPKTYLPAIAEALANQTGHPRDLASWAVHTWHDVLAAPLPPKFTDVVVRNPSDRPPSASVSLTAALVVGFCAFLASGLAECVTIRWYGPTIVQTMIAERAAPKPDAIRTRDRDGHGAAGERFATFAPMGLVLAGGSAGIAAFGAWALAGGTWWQLSKGSAVAAAAGGISCAGLNALAISSRGGLALAPPVESVAILALVGVLTFAATYGVLVKERGDPWVTNETDQPNGDDPIQFGSWTSE